LTAQIELMQDKYTYVLTVAGDPQIYTSTINTVSSQTMKICFHEFIWFHSTCSKYLSNFSIFILKTMSLVNVVPLNGLHLKYFHACSPTTFLPIENAEEIVKWSNKYYGW